MSYPGPKVHRASRRRLGRGQYPPVALITTSWTSPTTSGAVLHFSDAVNVSGRMPLAFNDATTIATQVNNSPTQITFTFTGGSSSTTVTLPNYPATAVGQRGQPVAGSTTTL